MNFNESNSKNQALFPDLVPWEGYVGCSQLIDEIHKCISRFVVLDDEQAYAITLWILHTYFIRAKGEIQLFDHTPYLLISSPEKRCGKSTLREIIAELVPRPLNVMNASTASLYRVISSRLPTLLIDEADTFFSGKSELAGILNSGYKQDGNVIRQTGKSYEITTEFSTWCAKLIAGIGNISDTTQSRCIVISLKRKLATEVVDRRNQVLSDFPNYFLDLQRKILKFVLENESCIMKQSVTLPNALDDRSQDNWRGLLKIAYYCGEDDGLRANQAALKLSAINYEESTDAIELLKDIAFLLPDMKGERIASSVLVQKLNIQEDRPWATYQKSGLTPYHLSMKLKPFNIKPELRKVDGSGQRGYLLSELKSVIDRYM
jgi:putative DNA primase/helicase